MQFPFYRAATPVVGIDIGSSSIKAVVLTSSEASPDYTLMIPHHDDVVAALMQVRKQLPSTIKQAVIAVAGTSVMTKMIQMDANLNDEQLEAEIEIEAENLIPHPLDDVYLDFESMGLADEPSKQNVVLAACHRDAVDQRVAWVHQGGFEANIVDVEGLALARAVATDYGDDKPIAVLELGYTKSILVKNGNFGTPEVLELAAALPDLEQELSQSQLVDWCGTLSQLLVRALSNGMVDEASDDSCAQLLLVSGGGRFHGEILTQLQKRLPMSCQSLVLERWPQGEESHHYGTAYGLALRGFCGRH
ncbi:type IV pilus biogenesis protein PilM [Ferrimonas aestuarii]|uniref:Type IV pilus assembly protein PilM n=1 Tax=Ferrimonas aestuarii TaxID=2569539 RepID=A0A4U1BGI4_9GAMM|nr:pilus assembly protein PilM [Ferrimonas aestuarii]TKB49129.1 hypothetical protein FCL42_21130 [Ferrimonas aestuarii]